MTNPTTPLRRLDPVAHELGISTAMARWWIKNLSLPVHRPDDGQTAPILLDAATVDALRAHLEARRQARRQPVTPQAGGATMIVTIGAAPKAPRPRLRAAAGAERVAP
jgi:hypothetical protein